MKIPIGVTLDEDLLGEIHKLRAKLLVETNESWTFSKVLNLLISIGIENFSNSKMKKYIENI